MVVNKEKTAEEKLKEFNDRISATLRKIARKGSAADRPNSQSSSREAK